MPAVPWRPEPSVGELADGDAEIGRVFVEQIPLIRRKLGCHPVDQAGRPDQTQGAGMAEPDPQQPVEAGEMIHVAMADEDLTFQFLPCPSPISGLASRAARPSRSHWS